MGPLSKRAQASETRKKELSNQGKSIKGDRETDAEHGEWNAETRTNGNGNEEMKMECGK
jgi:hypothetical protein